MYFPAAHADANYRRRACGVNNDCGIVGAGKQTTECNDSTVTWWQLQCYDMVAGISQPGSECGVVRVRTSMYIYVHMYIYIDRCLGV